MTRPSEVTRIGLDLLEDQLDEIMAPAPYFWLGAEAVENRWPKRGHLADYSDEFVPAEPGRLIETVIREALASDRVIMRLGRLLQSDPR